MPTPRPGLDIIYKFCLVIPSNPIPTPMPFIKIVFLSPSFLNYHLHLSFAPIRPEKYSTISAFKEHNSKRDQRSHFFYS
ncbi:hypothetical protein I7I50_04364 [Histoplasma capsulatum G186AR]|uniref:Uncharacterized protein n=1 Tax=Ajellomyces capsulatus TaxID=5037 RepID=A0A8H8CXY1_AJECA|nr:hypothetical protein I7I52_05272 [Histoplasma capsulatum]QSS75274.1 hypothetical protein I7I50_04364 [Histoplasma capsulatum G186AR]